MRKSQVPSYKENLTDDIHINLTPLIDVVFVVLIMFIIVAPMLELDRVQLASSAQKDSKEMTIVQESGPITIHVHADDSIWFNSKLVSEQQLLILLKEAKKLHANRIPQLFHDKKGPLWHLPNCEKCHRACRV